jgi:Rps23 Pro-64 3,4-dihydroxylase Tpa1-like proline 4-hydroxylase
MTFFLNDSLDLARLAVRYQEKRRIQVRDVLRPQSAEEILAIVKALPWGLAFNQGSRVIELDAARLAQLSAQDRADMLQSVIEGARSGYQFLYSYYPLFAAYFAQGRPHHSVFSIYEFLNSTPFLDFIRKLTGHQGIRWADAQATRFRAGHFLKYHTDEAPEHKRVAAYVMNFTKGWGRDWGGLLQFFDAQYDVEHAYRPIFNGLNIFTVPADHSVSMVANYVTQDRLSITGWFREDEPPAPIRPA